jgi:hypothetical protein
MTVDNVGWRDEDTEKDAGDAAHMNEAVTNSDLDDAAMLQCDNRSAIITPPSLSPEIPESNSGATLEEERQLRSSRQGDSTSNPSGKRSRSLSGSDRIDGRSSDWVFDVFAEDDSGTEGDSWLLSKRARSSSRPSEAAKNASPLAVAVMDVHMSGHACDDRPLRGDQDYEVYQIVGESGSGYEVTASMTLWLPKASVHAKLVRKYRAKQRAAIRVRTRWSSRLRNRR